jgi:hypothetical protein
MRKDQVDLINATVWISDSKTPNGVAEIPLTPLAVEAFKSQLHHVRNGTILAPKRRKPMRPSEDSQDRSAENIETRRDSFFPNL